ncbi:hypothetical protein [Sulfurimonas xiamenensis]|uniref:Uncharacterized protein n=1 Tax=Sulfurimonas xiamenensis TaxID=2590021 RepID=A0AAJ4A2V1_9BACT|nr:hypothetical protein [Sulfurimonas xiamenensis]QFR42887.1 hypothetical protein FJR47_02760 [Sulfurimonas xiamenensis]
MSMLKMIFYKKPFIVIALLIILSIFKPFTVFKYSSAEINEYNNQLLFQKLQDGSFSDKAKSIIASQNIKATTPSKIISADKLREYQQMLRYNHYYQDFILLLLIGHITFAFLIIYSRANNG